MKTTALTASAGQSVTHRPGAEACQRSGQNDPMAWISQPRNTYSSAVAWNGTSSTITSAGARNWCQPPQLGRNATLSWVKIFSAAYEQRYATTTKPSAGAQHIASQRHRSRPT